MNHYEALHLPRTATTAEIEARYKAMIYEHHPDRGGDPARFRRVKEAGSVLRDVSSRAQYDRELAAAASSGSTASGNSSPAAGSSATVSRSVSADDVERFADKVLPNMPPVVRDVAGAIFRVGVHLKRRRQS